MIKFINEKRQPTQDEMVVFSTTYSYGGGIVLEAWDSEEPYAMVTQNIPGIDLADNEVIINHDVLSANGFDGRDFLGDFLDYFTDDSREITFGPFNTKTLAVKLKDNWRDLVVPMEV